MHAFFCLFPETGNLPVTSGNFHLLTSYNNLIKRDLFLNHILKSD
jgi:hypothetical protein